MPLKNCKETKLLNAADKIAYRNDKIYSPCDLLLVATIIFPESIKSQHNHYVTVDYSKCTLGQMIVDQPKGNVTQCNENTLNPIATVIERLDKAECEKAIRFVVKCQNP